MASDSTATAAAAAKHSDPTFRSYSSTQAATYASQRLSYPSLLYNAVLEYHAATGGQFSQLLDVGCGPGNATRDVAVSFDRALGVDPGEAMIAAARGKGGKTRDGGDVKYVVGAAEELGNVEGVGEGSVDLVIAAMAVGYSFLLVFLDISRIRTSQWVENLPRSTLFDFELLYWISADLLARRIGSIWTSSGRRPRRC